MATTRVADVERIYMTFGKLGGDPIEFLSKPYEQCLSGIAVTHMPRYLIDMRLSEGETIFDKIGIDYDTLRKMDNPISPVAKYYREQLKPGESLWWTGENVDEPVSATMRLWRNVSPEEKKRRIAYGCVHFPEVFNSNYDRYSLWLGSQGIVNSNVRDGFSAGGQEEVKISNSETVKVPAIYRRVRENKDYINHLIIHDHEFDFEIWRDNTQTEESTKRILGWIERISKISNTDYDISVEVLKKFLLK
jgi:hypothetical protein